MGLVKEPVPFFKQKTKEERMNFSIPKVGEENPQFHQATLRFVILGSVESFLEKCSIVSEVSNLLNSKEVSAGTISFDLRKIDSEDIKIQMKKGKQTAQEKKGSKSFPFNYWYKNKS
jgi:hypothetical protein